MNIKQQKSSLRWGWIVGLAFLLHVPLLILTFLYIQFYSFQINPGFDDQFYQDYAFNSRIWINAALSFPFFLVSCFLWARRLNDHIMNNILIMTVAFVMLDIVSEYIWGGGLEWEHLIAHGAKFLGGYLGVRLT